MPTLTTLRIGLPVCPVHSPDRTRSAKALIRCRTSWTSFTTSTPSTISERLRGIRSATCRTERFSETLIRSPANIASRRSGTPRSWARRPSSIIVSSVTRFLEKSRWRPAPSATSRSPRLGSAAKRSRRCASRICAKWRSSSPQAAAWRSGGTSSLTAVPPHAASAPRLDLIEASRSFQESTKACFPSSWRRTASASTSMPASPNSARTCSASPPSAGNSSPTSP